MKLCNRCGLEKAPEEFHRDRSTADGLRSRCKACVKEYDDERREERNRRARELYEKNPQAKIARTRQYHLDNPEWSRERLREHHVTHREERYERYLERGQDPVVRVRRREATRRSESRRRAIKSGVDAELISEEQFAARLAEFGGKCYICETLLGANLHWDHYQPLTAGGAHVLGNLRPSCDLCNIRKSNCWPFTEKRLNEIKKEVLELRKQRVSQPGMR